MPNNNINESLFIHNGNNKVRESLFKSQEQIKNMKRIKPKNFNELQKIINEQIKIHGNNCDLNFIDISNITNMRKLFFKSDFNGDISGWDVSGVTNMSWMFYGSKFNGDISLWTPFSLERAYRMFALSDFDGDISEWNLSSPKIETLGCMFLNSKFSGNNTDFSQWEIDPEETICEEMFKGSKCKNIPKWAEE